MIPKIIHYCWLSNDPIPEKLQEYMKSWKEKLPDYEFKLWNFDCFDINSSQWVKEAFEAKKYAFAADYIRLYAVYNYGGIYMDMDVEVIKSLNPLLNNDYLLGYENQIGIEAGIFGASPKADWVKLILDYYQNKSFYREDGTQNTTPLPKIIFKILTANKLLNKHIYPLSPDYLTAKSYKTGQIHTTSNTYTIHHFAGSWHGPKEKLYKLVKNILGEHFAKLCSRIYKKFK